MNILDMDWYIDLNRIENNKENGYYTYINERLKKFYIIKEKIYKNKITYRHYFGWLKNIEKRWNNKEKLRYRILGKKQNN